MLVTNTIVAFIPPIVGYAFGLDLKTGVRVLLIGLCYAHVIGGLANVIVPMTWPISMRFATPMNWFFRIGLLLACAAVGCLLICLILVGIGVWPASKFWTIYAQDMKICVLLTLVIGTGITLYESMRSELDETTLQLRTKELERERAQKLATEAQLASLESRIHPHFLFNALNSISSLIPEDPEKAERLVEQMAALLRFSLNSNQVGLVPLEREMKIVAGYLEIEKARFGGRLSYSLNVPVELGEAPVPPLSVQTLVENSVKFAVAPNRSGGEIAVSATRNNGTLQLTVADSGPGFDPDAAPAGHGIDNLRGRLATLFGSRATLSAGRYGGRNAVLLSLPRNASN
jgi:sensor histidine kinase YesM